MRLNIISAGILFACSLALSACNDQKSSAEQQTQSSAEQQEIAKYNAYVETANSLNTPFAKELSDYRQYREPDVISGNKLDNYSVASSLAVTNIREKLGKATALPFAMPEIDAPAKSFEEALKKFEPIDSELGNYADSKGYLSDGGKKARERNAAYVAALTDVANAEAAFLSGIEKRDELNTRTAFEKAAKDSQDYYRAGLILNAKQAVRLGDAVFETQGSKEAIEPFRASLDQVAAMADGWDRKVKEATPNGCTSMMGAINDFLALGRTVIQHAEHGDYVPRPDAPAWNLNNALQYDQGTFQLRFNAMIGIFNYPRC
ncbi:conserved exported hypothetical protein [uncultured Pleomorphomonas sp.]|uniref:Lipoprotein n=1 Tax=uncultured Pleomorphomonas sp. TaxID=442121 RepID=A0A212L352_9HYPH|nr:conserved exported hypothetical protein [uncultured Pleomorphomonas sp.]